MCSGLPAAGRYSVSRPTPHVLLRAISTPVRHFYSTPPNHHLNLSQRDTHTHTKYTCCKHQNLPVAKTRFLMRGGAICLLSLWAAGQRALVCVLLWNIHSLWGGAHYDFMCACCAAPRPLFRWMKLCANLENSSLLLAQRTAVLCVESCWTRLLIKLCRRFAKKFSLLVRVSTLLCALYIWLFCEHKHIALNSKIIHSFQVKRKLIKCI